MRTILKIEDSDVESVANMIVAAFQRGNKLMVCGNGGSGADAQHFVGELVCTFKDHERKGLPAICLNCNTSVITAWANDESYDQIFVRQLEALGKAGDVFVAISTSGQSENILNALYYAKQNGIYTILLTGVNCRTNKNVDHAVVIDSDDTPRIQEHHIYFIHNVCETIEKKMKGAK